MLSWRGFTGIDAPMRTGQDDYYTKLISAMAERHNGEDPDQKLREIARQEVNRKLSMLVAVIAIGWAIIVSINDNPSRVIVAIILGVFWLGWSVEFNPEHDRHLIISQAEDLNRLFVISQIHSSGDMVWTVADDVSTPGAKSIVVEDSHHWDGSERRVFHYAQELERISPRRRRKKLFRAAKQAKAVLIQGGQLAKNENAELVYWASDFVHQLKLA